MLGIAGFAIHRVNHIAGALAGALILALLKSAAAKSSGLPAPAADK
jgi:hypothetical protein